MWDGVSLLAANEHTFYILVGLRRSCYIPTFLIPLQQEMRPPFVYRWPLNFPTRDDAFYHIPLDQGTGEPRLYCLKACGLFMQTFSFTIILVPTFVVTWFLHLLSLMISWFCMIGTIV